MEHEIFLYPYSKAEAGRRGELDRWEESFRANVSCAREIEAAIRGYSNVDGILQPGAAQSILNQWGFKRTNFVLANTLQQLGPIKDRLSEANRNWQCGAYIPQDGTNRYFAVDTALICMDQFIGQVRDAYKQLELLGPEHCADAADSNTYTAPKRRQSKPAPRQSPPAEAASAAPVWVMARKPAGTGQISLVC